MCLTLPKRVHHRVWSSVSSFNFQYPLVSLKSCSNCLHLLPCIPVTSIFTSLFLSIPCLRRQFLHKMWPIKLTFLLFYCMYDIPLLLDSMEYFLISHTICLTYLLHHFPAPHFIIFQALSDFTLIKITDNFRTNLHSICKQWNYFKFFCK